MKFIFKWLIAGTVALLLNACVTSPTNGEIVSPHQPIEFSGYAFNPGAVVEIKAFNKLTSTWDTVKTTTASTTRFPIGDDDLYSWSTEVLFSELPDWQCYWGSPCIINPPDATASIMVEEPLPSGGVNSMVTFDSGFLECVGDKLVSDGAYAAGWACRSRSSPVLYLLTIT